MCTLLNLVERPPLLLLDSYLFNKVVSIDIIYLLRCNEENVLFYNYNLLGIYLLLDGFCYDPLNLVNSDKFMYSGKTLM